ncbi:EutP/PduV family microcompartment system protein, partial [Salmonella enterica]
TSQCGKTTLMQIPRGDARDYKKTQAIEWALMAIDTTAD